MERGEPRGELELRGARNAVPAGEMAGRPQRRAGGERDLRRLVREWDPGRDPRYDR